MKFIRTKKLVFLNNKWWVWKTTIAYNTACKFAEKWYKTVLIDLDPQCNLSRLALWENFDNNLFSNENIYKVLQKVLKWAWDVDYKVPFTPIWENLSILPWSIKLSQYHNLLISAYNLATAGEEIWYFQTSAIQRFLNEKWLDEQIDIFIIDVSPSLDLLNRIILLWSDYFITPLNPDAFSLQWIENLWKTLEDWKTHWKRTWGILCDNVPMKDVLKWEWLFIGYIINSYNQYGKKAIKTHEEWMEKIPASVKEYLSYRHCKNGLVESSYKKSLVDLKDVWTLATAWQEVSKPIFNLIPWKDFVDVDGTKENLELAKEQFEELFLHIEKIFQKY